MNLNGYDAASVESALRANVSIAVPTPAEGQTLVYANLHDEVILMHAVEGGAHSFTMEPDEARALADKLYDAAYAADGGGDLGEFSPF